MLFGLTINGRGKMRKALLLAALAGMSWSAASVASADYFLEIKGIAPSSGSGPLYLKVRSTGDLDGDGLPDDAVLRITCAAGKIAASHLAALPRDAASGQASGKRMHQPATFVKEWGPSSPQLMSYKPGYDLKSNTKARMAAGSDGWTSVTLSGVDGLCPAAEAAAKATKSRSNIQNN